VARLDGATGAKNCFSYAWGHSDLFCHRQIFIILVVKAGGAKQGKTQGWQDKQKQHFFYAILLLYHASLI